MLRSLLFLVPLVCVGQSSLLPGQVEVGGGYALLRQNVNADDGYDSAAAFAVRVGLSPRLAVGFFGVSGPYKNQTFFNGRGPYTTQAGFTAALGEVRYSFSTKRWSPYVTGSAGVVAFQDIRSDAPDAGFVISDLNLRNGSQFAYGFGGGVTAALTKRFGVDVGIRLTKGQDTEFFYTPIMGVYYRFGK